MIERAFTSDGRPYVLINGVPSEKLFIEWCAWLVIGAILLALGCVAWRKEWRR